jgi:hypothetical protein
MNTTPIVSRHCARSVARYRRRKSVRSRTTLAAAAATKATGSVARNGQARRSISVTVT